MREHRKMTLKRIGIGILCMVFVLSMLAPLVAFAEEKTESGSQVSKRELAYIQISVGDGQETPVFKAGQKVSEFRINVKNNGNVDAHNVRIEPDIKNASDWPFELDKLNYEKELSTIKSGGQTAAVWGSEEKPLIVRGDVTGKSYKLEFNITRHDEIFLIFVPHLLQIQIFHKKASYPEPHIAPQKYLFLLLHCYL